MVLFLFITFINNMGAFLFNKGATDAFAPYPFGLKKVAREGRNHYNDTS